MYYGGKNECELHAGEIYLNLISHSVNKAFNMLTLPQEGSPLSHLRVLQFTVLYLDF